MRENIHSTGCLNKKVLDSFMGLPWWLRVYSVCMQYWRPRFEPWVGKILLWDVASYKAICGGDSKDWRLLESESDFMIGYINYYLER